MSSFNVSFDKEKAIQCILYVANRLHRRDFHKIFKIIYFADRQHLQTWGRPIVGDTYIAMDAGPVPSRIYDMVKAVRGDSYHGDIDGLSQMFNIESWMYIIPKKDADITKLSVTDKKILDETLAEYGNLTYDEIKEKSHDIAWRSTAKDFAISWEYIAREAGMDSDDIAYLTEVSLVNSQLTVNACHG